MLSLIMALTVAMTGRSNPRLKELDVAWEKDGRETGKEGREGGRE